MKNFKQIIANQISRVTNINEKELYTYIETPKDIKNGNYSFPCFRLAKELKKAPPVIANEIKDGIEKEIEQIQEIEKVDVIGGYLNFFINKTLLIEEVLKEVAEKEEYGKSELGKGKNIVIDYSAPNIAKPFHIGHLRTTLIGNALYKIYKYLGYNTIRNKSLRRLRYTIWKNDRSIQNVGE